MKCGAKCFLVEVEENNERKIIPVNARTPVAARKVIRRQFGVNTEIIRVKKKLKSANSIQYTSRAETTQI